VSERPQAPDPVCVVVRARARPGMAEEVARELGAMSGPIRANPDCLEFRVCQGRDDPAAFVVWERWSTREAGVANLERPYMAAYLARADELFEQRAWAAYDELQLAGEGDAR
jgi:quinol monooxygenase YgiN